MTDIQKQYDLTEGVVWKKVLGFALPVLLGIIFQQLYTLVDAVIVGRFAGKEALAAIESVHTIVRLPVNFFTGLSSGAAIIISKYYGAKQLDSVSSASHTAVLFAFIGGLLLAILCITLSRTFIQLIKVPDDIVKDAFWYVVIYFSGLVASMTYNIGAGIFRAVGNSKTPLYFLIAANFLNIVLDVLFVGVFHLGVVGAALATLLSQVVSAILVIVALTRTDLPCKIYLHKIRIHRAHLIEIFKLGLPIGIQSTLYPISNTIIQTSINTFGVNAIAAWAVCGKLDFLVWYAADAFATTAATFVAQNHGAMQYKRAKKGVTICVGISLLLTAVVGCILFFWNAPLGRLLVDDNEVIALSTQIMSLIAPLYVLYTLGAVLPGAIRGSGETVKPMFITLLSSCAFRVLWIWIVVPLHPTFMMVLACYPLSWGISSLAYLILYKIHFKKPPQNTEGLLAR